MNLRIFSLGDIAVLIVYFILLFYINIRLKNVKTKAKHHHFKKQHYSNIVLVCLIFGSTTGAGSTLGLVSICYNLQNILYFALPLFSVIPWLIMTFLFASRNNIERFRDCQTISQLMYRFYGGNSRVLTNCASLMYGICSISIQILGFSLIIRYFLGINILYSLIISYAFAFIYSIITNTQNSINIDILQFCLVFFIMPISYVIASRNIGGIQHVVLDLIKDSIRNYNDLSFWQSLSIIIPIFILPAFSPPQIERCLMAQDTKQLKSALITISAISFPFSLSICIIVFILQFDNPGLAFYNNEALLYYSAHYLPKYISGLMIAGIIAAISAVINANVSAIRNIIIHDIVKPIHQYNCNNKNHSDKSTYSDKSIKLYTYISTFVIISASAFFLFFLSSYNIINAVSSIRILWCAVICIPLSSGLIGFRFISSSVFTIAFMATLALIVFINNFSTNLSITFILFVGIFINAMILFGSHYLIIMFNAYKKYKIIKKISHSKHKNYISNNFLMKIYNLNYVDIRNIISYEFRSQFKKIINNINYILYITKAKIKDHLIDFNSVLKRQTRQYDYKFYAFILSHYIIYSLHLTRSTEHTILMITLIFGYFLCFISFFKEILLNARLQERYWHIFLYFTVIFCLPVVSIYMLFISHNDVFWSINALLAIFALYFFTNSKAFLIALLIGGMFAYLLYKITLYIDIHTYHYQYDAEGMNTINYIILHIYAFMIFFSVILMRGKEKQEEEKLEVLKMFSSVVAHELKTPSSTIYMCAQLIEDIIIKSNVSYKAKNDANQDNTNNATHRDNDSNTLLNDNHHIDYCDNNHDHNNLNAVKEITVINEDKLNYAKIKKIEKVKGIVKINTFNTSSKDIILSKNNMITITMTQEEYDILNITLDTIVKLSKLNTDVVNNTLVSLKHAIVTYDTQYFQISQCVNEAINEYKLYQITSHASQPISIKIKNDFYVQCSPYYMKQLIINLLKNVCMHCGPEVRIDIFTTANANKLIFKDYGKGIEKAHLKLIFKDFYTGHQQGIGFGLAFCRVIMEDIGGNITCSSRIGKYTKFILTFPELVMNTS